MTDGDGIDRTGITSDSNTNITGFSTELTQYLYPKLSSIANGGEFSAEEIEEYDLTESNGQIVISTTKKLINYLKSFVKKSIKELESDIDDKLDKSDYIVDDALSNNSRNPVENKIINTKFGEIESSLNNKSNINHTHDFSGVNGLNNKITSIESDLSSKANNSDLTNHKNNKQNPHDVTASQLNINWQSTSVDGVYVCYPLNLIRITKTLHVTLSKENWANTLLVIPSQFHPNYHIYFLPIHNFTVSQRLMCRINTNGVVQIWGTVGDSKTIIINTIYYCNDISGGTISL